MKKKFYTCHSERSEESLNLVPQARTCSFEKFLTLVRDSSGFALRMTLILFLFSFLAPKAFAGHCESGRENSYDTYCSGTDLWMDNGPSCDHTFLESNSTYCGYTPPPPAVIQPPDTTQEAAPPTQNCGVPTYQYTTCNSCNYGYSVLKDSCGAISYGDEEFTTQCSSYNCPVEATPPPPPPPPASTYQQQCIPKTCDDFASDRSQTCSAGENSTVFEADGCGNTLTCSGTKDCTPPPQTTPTTSPTYSVYTGVVDDAQSQAQAISASNAYTAQAIVSNQQPLADARAAQDAGLPTPQPTPTPTPNALNPYISLGPTSRNCEAEPNAPGCNEASPPPVQTTQASPTPSSTAEESPLPTVKSSPSVEEIPLPSPSGSPPNLPGPGGGPQAPSIPVLSGIGGFFANILTFGNSTTPQVDPQIQALQTKLQADDASYQQALNDPQNNVDAINQLKTTLGLPDDASNDTVTQKYKAVMAGLGVKVDGDLTGNFNITTSDVNPWLIDPNTGCDLTDQACEQGVQQANLEILKKLATLIPFKDVATKSNDQLSQRQALIDAGKNLGILENNPDLAQKVRANLRSYTGTGAAPLTDEELQELGLLIPAVIQDDISQHPSSDPNDPRIAYLQRVQSWNQNGNAIAAEAAADTVLQIGAGPAAKKGLEFAQSGIEKVTAKSAAETLAIDETASQGNNIFQNAKDFSGGWFGKKAEPASAGTIQPVFVGASETNGPAATVNDVMQQYGLDPNTIVYRSVNRNFVNEATGTITANPNSVASVRDVYSPFVTNPFEEAYPNAGLSLPKVPQTIAASSLEDPSLNVGLSDISVSGYGYNPLNQGGAPRPDYVTVGIRLGDVLKQGGKIYPDSSAVIDGAFIVTVPKGSVQIALIDGKAVEATSPLVDNAAENVARSVSASDLSFQVSQAESVTEKVAKAQDLTKTVIDDPKLADVVNAYIESPDHGSVIRDIMLNDDGRVNLLQRINDVHNSQVDASQQSVDALTEALKQRQASLFVDDSAKFNIDPGTRQTKLGEWIEQTGKADPEKAITAQDVATNRDQAAQAVKPLLDKLQNVDRSQFTNEIGKIVQQTDAEVEGTSVRTKEVDSLLNKLLDRAKKEPAYSVGNATDLVGGRIVVSDLKDLETISKEVEDFYGGRILEKGNKLLDNQGTDNPYRGAIHYLIKSPDGGQVWELQLKTSSSALSSTLNHNVVYKPDILKLPKELQAVTADYNWKSNQLEIMDYFNSL